MTSPYKNVVLFNIVDNEGNKELAKVMFNTDFAEDFSAKLANAYEAELFVSSYEEVEYDETVAIWNSEKGQLVVDSVYGYKWKDIQKHFGLEVISI